MEKYHLLPGFLSLIKELEKMLDNKDISWEELMKIRLKANEKLNEHENQELCQYEEKISMKKLFFKHNVPTTKVSNCKCKFYNLFANIIISIPD